VATVAFAPTLSRRISLAEIDAAVSARLGPSRVPGNAQPACFNRQVAMYLARHVGRWSTTAIGRFYNGRDHSTVCHGIQRIEALRESDSDVDSLISELRQQLFLESDPREQAADASLGGPDKISVNAVAEIVAARVCAYLEMRMRQSELAELDLTSTTTARRISRA
jgi:hypothetical protein